MTVLTRQSAVGEAQMHAAKQSEKKALRFEVVARCSTTKARVSRIHLPHATVQAPVFMPVGTQGAMKGVTTLQLEQMGCNMILGNTYHLGMRPGPEVFDECGGLHEFMKWPRGGLLTDSGGFQMVSLLELAEITEQGVEFQSPHDGSRMLLTPEKSIQLQNSIGADIIMQLDDVVSSLTSGPRVEEAMLRSVRWLDRCIEAHSRPAEQNLFAIIQGGLDPQLRRRCIDEMVKRDLPGYAIGGLSGGEEKDKFWRIVDVCTDLLPLDKPRYCMGVGFAVDLVVCSALGVDMYDCVYPTRTARFGNALTRWGSLTLKNSKFASDLRPIDEDCECMTCKTYTRAHLHKIVRRDAAAGSLLSIHNIAYQMSLMKSIRESITHDRFPQFIRQFFKDMYADPADIPQWAVNALAKVNINL